MSTPECDLACQTKIIIDGDLLGAVFSITGERLTKFHKRLDFQPAIDLAFQDAVFRTFEFLTLIRESIGADAPDQKYMETAAQIAQLLEDTCQLIEAFKKPIPRGREAILKLIAAEDLAFKWQRLVLEGMGHQGPWPKCLS